MAPSVPTIFALQKQLTELLAMNERFEPLLLRIDDAELVTYSNARPEFHFGWSASELMGAHFIAWLPPADHRAFNELLGQLTTGEFSTMETHFHHREGHWCPASLSITPSPYGGAQMSVSSRESGAPSDDLHAAMERRSHALIEAFAQGFAILFDQDLAVILLGGDHIPRLFNAPEEAVGKPLAEIVPASLYGEVMVEAQAVLLGIRRSFSLTYQGVHYECQGIPVSSDDAQRTEGILLCWDNTPQTTPQKSPHLSDNQLRALLTALPDFVFEFTADESILSARTPNFKQLFMPDQVFIGKKVEDSFPEHVVLLLREGFARLRDNAGPVSFTFTLTIDGEPRTYDCHMAQEGDEGTSLAIMRDVTTRQIAQKDLAVMEAAVHHSTDAIFIMSIKGTIDWVNPAMEKDSGYTVSELIGASIEMLKISPLGDETMPEVWECIEQGVTWRGRMEFECKSGEPYTVDSVITPNISELGAIDRFVFVNTNISKTLALEEQLRQSQKMESMGALAGGIAHDFNNILSPILGYSEMSLEDEGLSEDTRENIISIIEAANRAQDLVRQILTFSRKGHKEMKPVKLGVIVTEVTKMLRAVIPSTIEMKCNVETNEAITADATMIHQVLVNLCTNAWHAMEENPGTIAIGVREVQVSQRKAELHAGAQAGPHLLLLVADEGKGIPPEVLDKIFDPYFTTKESGHGTGLGLAVVSSIIREHKGFISVSSTPGRGSTFSIYFPKLLRGSGPNTQYKTKSYPIGKEHVLLVDDDQLLVKLIKKVLEKMGYRVSAYDKSTQALAQFMQTPDAYDLLLTDMTMPEMQGDALMTQVLAIRPDLPVVIFTGFSKTIDEKRARELGASAFLAKPVRQSQLAEAIRGALDAKKKR